MPLVSTNNLWRDLIDEHGNGTAGLRAPTIYEINALRDRPVEQRAELIILRTKAQRRRVWQIVLGCATLLMVLLEGATFGDGVCAVLALTTALAYFFVKKTRTDVVTKAWLIWKFPPDSNLYVTDAAKAASRVPTPGTYSS